MTMTAEELYHKLRLDPDSLLEEDEDLLPLATQVKFKGVDGEALLINLVMAGSARFGFAFTSGQHAGKEVYLGLDWTNNRPELLGDLAAAVSAFAAQPKPDGLIRYIYQVDDSSDGMWFNTDRRDVDFWGGDPIEELDGRVLEIE